jgi:hypothetical protein
MRAWHANWVHFYTDAESYRRKVAEDRDVLEQALKPGGVGCRLVPTEASWRTELPAGQLLVMQSTWVNRNNGRCFRRYPLQILSDRFHRYGAFLGPRSNVR